MAELENLDKFYEYGEKLITALDREQQNLQEENQSLQRELASERSNRETVAQDLESIMHRLRGE